ncbi:conserved hypothetical protein [Coccidioides posadasii str. Silveira]|uniref:Uncharacterized protein n=1 Tax=Coccidioides posadasii (strain RMSCC 757 / Silveira) TaxID=443226 RepID=E9DK29_COCPS|nr:conserved hypothetical protein [Coccidioides posadasii str. Silveira]
MGKLLPRLKDKDLLGFGKSISRLRSVKRQPELDGSTTEKACASYESYLQRKQQRGLQQRSRKNILRPYSGPVRGDLRTWRVAPGPVRVPLEQMRGGPRTSARYPPDVGARAPWSRCAMTPGPVRDDPRTSAR